MVVLIDFFIQVAIDWVHILLLPVCMEPIYVQVGAIWQLVVLFLVGIARGHILISLLTIYIPSLQLLQLLLELSARFIVNVFALDLGLIHWLPTGRRFFPKFHQDAIHCNTTYFERLCFANICHSAKYWNDLSHFMAKIYDNTVHAQLRHHHR